MRSFIRFGIAALLLAAMTGSAQAGEGWTYADQVRANQMDQMIRELRNQRYDRSYDYGYGGYAPIYRPRYTPYYQPYVPVNPYIVPQYQIPAQAWGF